MSSPVASGRYIVHRDALRQAVRLVDAAYAAPSEYLLVAGCHQALWLALKTSAELAGEAVAADVELDALLDAFLARHAHLLRTELFHFDELRRMPAALAHHRAHPGLEQAGRPPFDREERCREIHRLVHLVRRELVRQRPSRLRAWLGLGAAASVLLGLLAWQHLWPHVGRAEGVRVTYFRGTDLTHPVCRRVEPALAVGYGEGRPALGVPAQEYSSRWTGWLLVPATTSYAFFAQSDDGLRLWLDDEAVIDNWRDQDWANSAKHAQRELTAGPHRLRLEHYKRSGNGALRVRWGGGPVPDNTELGAPYLQLRPPGVPCAPR